ncbi:MAG: disulfide bond formation protein B [Bacteroidota bacterium]
MPQTTVEARGARRMLWAIVAISIGALAAAFAGQYLFSLEPCVLCLYERVPWTLAALVAAVGLAGRAGRRDSELLALCAAIFAAGGGLAVYHIGIEQHWWGSIAGCAGGPVGGLTLDDLRPESLATELKPCDRVDWRLFGLSLAGYNMIASTLLSLGCLAGLVSLRRKPEP